MAIQAQYALISEIYRTGVSGKIDFLGLFDRVFASAVPAQHKQLVFSVLLFTDSEADLGKKAIRMTFMTPSQKTLFEQRGEVVFKPEGGSWLASARLVFDISGLSFPEFGKYWFTLQVAGRELTRHPLQVVQGTAPSK